MNINPYLTTVSLMAMSLLPLEAQAAVVNINASSVILTSNSHADALSSGLLEITSFFDAEFLYPTIRSETPRYQRAFNDPYNQGISPRVISQFSEAGGSVQFCMVSAIPDAVYYLDPEAVAGLNPGQIIDGVYNGNIGDLSLPTRENQEGGVPSNAHFIRFNGDNTMLVQGGRGANASFMAAIGSGEISIIDGTPATADQSGNRYMSAFDGQLNTFISGAPIVTIQHTFNDILVAQVYGEAPNLTAAFVDCNAQLENPDLQDELIDAESLVASFETAVIPSNLAGYDRLMGILQTQARGDTYADLQNGVVNLNLVRVEQSTAVVNGYPYGLNYSNEEGGNVLTSVGCYLKSGTTANGTALTMDISNSFLDPSVTSCTGREHARVVYPNPFTEVAYPSSGVINSSFNSSSGGFFTFVGGGHGHDGGQAHDDEGETPSPIPLPLGIILLTSGLAILARVKQLQRKPAIA